MTKLILRTLGLCIVIFWLYQGKYSNISLVLVVLSYRKVILKRKELLKTGTIEETELNLKVVSFVLVNAAFFKSYFILKDTWTK